MALLLHEQYFCTQLATKTTCIFVRLRSIIVSVLQASVVSLFAVFGHTMFVHLTCFPVAGVFLSFSVRSVFAPIEYGLVKLMSVFYESVPVVTLQVTLVSK